MRRFLATSAAQAAYVALEAGSECLGQQKTTLQGASSLLVRSLHHSTSAENKGSRGSLVWPPPEVTMQINPALSALMKQHEEELSNRERDTAGPGPMSHDAIALRTLEASKNRLLALMKKVDPEIKRLIRTSTLKKLPAKDIRMELRELGVRNPGAKDTAIDRLLRLLRPVMSDEEMAVMDKVRRQRSGSQPKTNNSSLAEGTGEDTKIAWQSADKVGLEVAAMLVEMRCRDVLYITVPKDKTAGYSLHGVLLATGTSERHCKACVEGVVYQLCHKYPECDLGASNPNMYAGRHELGLRKSEPTGWEVVDLTDPGPGLLVSVMTEEVRERYDLEERWCSPDLSNVVRVEGGQQEDTAEKGVKKVHTLETLSVEAEEELS